MKSIFNRMARKKSPCETEFNTLVPECEAMINSRPLTYTGSTIEDSVVIRPIDFLIPYANVNFMPSNEINKDDCDYIPKLSTRDEAIQNFKSHLSYLQRMWKFWTNNYLLELQTFTKRESNNGVSQENSHILGKLSSSWTRTLLVGDGR